MTKQKTNKVLEGLAKPTWQHPMPTNNQEKWEERFDKKWKRIESSIKTHISGRKIWDTSDGEEVEDSWKYVDETLESFLRQEIRQAKIEERERITKIIEEMKTDRKERTVLILMAVLAAINDRVTKENFDAVSNQKKQ